EDQKLDSWLKETIWPLEAKLRPLDVYHGALLSCLEMIKSGTTCFSDMYFYEEMVAKAVEESGMRAALASGIIEAGDAEKGEMMLKESIKIAKQLQGRADGRIIAKIGPHTAYTCSLSLLKRVREAASTLRVGIHIHLAESEDSSKIIEDRYGRGEIGLLDGIGFLGPDVLAAHCIHISREDIALLAKRDVKVVYNPVANMKLASGMARVKELLDAGITVGLGTDGPASNNSLDMFETMKVAALLQKTLYKDPTVLPTRMVLELATIKGATALGIDRLVGSLEPGKRADIVLVDMNKPHLTPLHDEYACLVYSARGSDVETVIINGKIVMEDREVKTLDEEEVMRKGKETAQDLLNR
ncbi:MAG: amidohydrolase family protein, partial [Candidatus Bathyarchaeia archaeon]